MLRNKQGKYFVGIFYLIIRRRIKIPNVVPICQDSTVLKAKQIIFPKFQDLFSDLFNLEFFINYCKLYSNSMV